MIGLEFFKEPGTIADNAGPFDVPTSFILSTGSSPSEATRIPSKLSASFGILISSLLSEAAGRAGYHRVLILLNTFASISFPTPGCS